MAKLDFPIAPAVPEPLRERGEQAPVNGRSLRALASAPTGTATFSSALQTSLRPPAHALIASSWATDERPAHAAFRVWTERYLAAADFDRPSMVEEGARLARARLAALAKLIPVDPEAALASAVPVALRQTLPDEIGALLEKRVSARGELALNAVTPAPGGAAPAEPYFRTAQIGRDSYRAHVYGRRAAEATYADTALVGIAVAGMLAVADSPLRVLEAGEIPPPSAPVITSCAACAAAARASTTGIAYEYAGAIGVAVDSAHFAADVAALEADNQPGTSSVLGRPSKTWTHGPKKVLIIRVVFSDTPGAADDAAVGLGENAAVQRFNAAGGVGEFFAKSSFGKTSLVVAPAVNDDSPDVTPVLRLARTGESYATTNDGDNSALHSDARKAATAAGVAPENYDRVGVVFPDLSEIPGSKITYGGLANVIGSNFWINGAYTFRVVTHELGHTYGLRHANLWQVSDGNPASEAGVSVGYGDPFDVMGGGEFFSATDDFGPWNKSLLQWIPDDAVTVAEAGGTYRIHRFDSAGADLSLPRALKVVRDPVRDYWIGFRRATANASLDGGAYVLWGYNTLKEGDLLDLSTPGVDAEDAGLAIGSTFDDAAAGVTLRPLAQGGSGDDEWLDVQVILQPRLRWVESAVLADEQRGAVSLVLRRSANAVGALSVNYATEAAEPLTAAAGVDYIHASGTVSWASGDTADKTVTIMLLPDMLVEGSEAFRVRLSGVSGGVRVGEAAATVTIADSGARDTSFLSDFINSTVLRVLPLPDGGLFAAGWFTQTQTSGFETLSRGGVLRLDAAGALNRDFDSASGASPPPVRDLALQPDGRLLLVGDFLTYAGVARNRIARVLPDGSLDGSFAVGAGANGPINAVRLLPDGRVLVAGEFTQFNGGAREYLARLLPDGSLDTTFVGPNFGDSSGWRVECLALQPDGKILVGGNFLLSGGSSFRSGICRIQPDGALDSSFTGVVQGAHAAGNTGFLQSVQRIMVQPDGRILIGGRFEAFNNTARGRFARLTSNGALDSGVVPTFDDDVNALVLQPDGSVLVGGVFLNVNGASSPGLARILPDGSLDAAFTAAGVVEEAIDDLALTVDGRLLLAGNPGALHGSSRERPIWRVLPGLSGTAGVVEFTADSYLGKESAAVVLTARRTGGKLGAIHVGYATARSSPVDTATAGADYAAASGFLAWEDGDDSPKTLSIPLSADALADEGETFTVRLGEPLVGGVFLGERRAAVVTITPAVAGPQTIAFPAPATRAFGDGTVSLVATTSSGLPVSFELVSGPATLDGSTLTPTGVGLVTVRATQAGNILYEAAAAVERSFAVVQGAQTIDFPAPAARNVGSAPFVLAATATSGLPVSFSISSGPATLDGSTLTVIGPGVVTLVATQAGDANYLAAPAVQRSFSVSAVASITLTNLAQTYAGAPRPIGFTSTPADLAVAITYAGASTAPTDVGSYPVSLTVTEPLVSGSAAGTLVISRAPLIARPVAQRRLVGTPNPPLAIAYEGLLGADTGARIDRPPTAKTTAAKSSKPGVYPITLSGGLDNNYALTLAPGSLRVVGFGGAYECLLRAPDGEDPFGKAELAVSATGPTFTGVLNLGAETAPISFKGTLALEPYLEDEGEDRASGRWTSTALAPRDYRVEFNIGTSTWIVSIYRGATRIAEGQGPRTHVPAPKTSVPWVGPHTVWFDAFEPREGGDLDPRPAPAGVGHAAVSVPGGGAIKLAANLADGAKFTAALKPDADGAYRVFARPYAKRGQSYVAGTVDLGEEDGRVFVWRKAGTPVAPFDANHRGGFDLKGRASSARWTPPRAATRVLPAITLAEVLTIDPASGAFHAAYLGADLGQSADTLPANLLLNAATNRISLFNPDAANPNPRKFSLTITPKTGAYSGSFTLTDPFTPPAKPTMTVSRKVTFSGVLRPGSSGGAEEPSQEEFEALGRGFFLVRPLISGAESESGEIRLTLPVP